MSMSDLELLRILLVNSKNVRDEQTYRAHTYGILMTLLLSKEVFKNNSDINLFLEQNKISFKPYVFQSRTQIIGRICRIIETTEIEKLKQINETVFQIAFKDDATKRGNSKVKKDENNENYFDSLLDQFKRDKS